MLWALEREREKGVRMDWGRQKLAHYSIECYITNSYGPNACYPYKLQRYGVDSSITVALFGV